MQSRTLLSGKGSRVDIGIYGHLTTIRFIFSLKFHNTLKIEEVSILSGNRQTILSGNPYTNPNQA